MKFRIRSIFTKIVLWFVATVALSLVGLHGHFAASLRAAHGPRHERLRG